MPAFQEKNSSKWTKDGRKWFFKCYYKNLQGMRTCKKSKLFLNKKEALEEERIFLNEVKFKIPTSNITFRQLKEDYYNYKKDKVKITTIDILRKRLNYISPLYNIKLNEFNINHFDIWKKEISNKKLSTSYKNNIYKTLRSLLNFAITYFDMIELNSILNKITNFTNPNELKKEMNFYTYEEFSRFIAEEKNLKYKAYFELLYYCGLRKGEANALNWRDDVDLANNQINVNKNVTQKIKGNKYVILPVKTKSSNRILPMPKVLVDDLKTLKKEYMEYSNFDDKWFVFGGIFPLSDTSVQVHRDMCCNLSGVKHIRIHDFRHSCASLLINNGASITLVAKYMGHSNISTTLNTYSHMFKNQFNDIINIIDKLNNN